MEHFELEGPFRDSIPAFLEKLRLGPVEIQESTLQHLGLLLGEHVDEVVQRCNKTAKGMIYENDQSRTNDNTATASTMRRRRVTMSSPRVEDATEIKEQRHRKIRPRHPLEAYLDSRLPHKGLPSVAPAIIAPALAPDTVILQTQAPTGQGGWNANSSETSLETGQQSDVGSLNYTASSLGSSGSDFKFSLAPFTQFLSEDGTLWLQDPAAYAVG